MDILKKILAELQKRFDLHPWNDLDEDKVSLRLYGNCGCHDMVMDHNCEQGWDSCFHPDLEKILDKHGAWAECENPEAFTIWLI